LRTLRLDRVHGVRATGTRFEPPSRYDASEIIQGNFGAYTGRENHEIRILLRNFAAKDALARPWHRSQKTTLQPNGEVEITLRLNNLVDIEREILGWGYQAQALSPPELCDIVLATLNRATAQYTSGGDGGLT
jgi:predicted DNA-binding transcriptional regulator YafY